VSDTKMKEGVFVGLQNRELMQSKHFEELNETERNAWLSLMRICKAFFGNHRVAKYQDVVHDLLTSYKPVGCNVSLKIHFVESHVDVFLENFGEVRDEHGERFHQDVLAWKSGTN